MFTELQQKIGYQFDNPMILIDAIKRGKARGQLELLGDAALGLAVSVKLMHLDVSEGDMTIIRSALVNNGHLASIARTIDLEGLVRVHSTSNSALADTMEAIIGAAFRDGGLSAVTTIMDTLFKDKLDSGLANLLKLDPKSALLEMAQIAGYQHPVYKDMAFFEDKWEVSVEVEGKELARGFGSSKKLAQQAAAEKALLLFTAE